jgi:histidyl-tRNA synthetase
LQPVRGTHDIPPLDVRRHRHVVEVARSTARRYGFEEIATPIFEFSEVFRRTLGETSDIVAKEMYTFQDRGGEEVTLRPEYTAGIARAFISGGMAQNLPLKFFASGPMFRYERPQKGRLRQFHQIDVEILGVATPHADIELVALGAHILNELGVADRVELEINSLGDAASRAAYRGELVAYLRGHEGSLSEDSLARLARNPLRILDSKDEGDRRVVAGAPPMSASLNEASAAFYAAVCDGLDALDIRYRHNERLVRGLDYYTHTAFEFVTDALGAQGAVIAGGRYDRLIETMGGPPTPGIGWAGGIERLAMLADTTPPAPRPIAVVPVSADEVASASKLAHDLRHAGFTIEFDYGGNLSRRLKRANKREARVALLIGGDEVARAVVTLRDLDSGDQSEVALAALPECLAPYR